MISLAIVRLEAIVHRALVSIGGCEGCGTQHLFWIKNVLQERRQVDKPGPFGRRCYPSLLLFGPVNQKYARNTGVCA